MRRYLTYPSSCEELPREAHINSWAAALSHSSIQQQLGKEINANSLGLLCLPSQLCKLCRNLIKVLILFQHPFPQPHAGRQANPTHLLHASAKPQKPFVVLPTVLPVASCFYFASLPHNHPLYSFSASLKGFFVFSKCFYKPQTVFFKSIFQVCKSAQWCDTSTLKDATLGWKRSSPIIRILFSLLFFFVSKSIYWRRKKNNLMLQCQLFSDTPPKIKIMFAPKCGYIYSET